MEEIWKPITSITRKNGKTYNFSGYEVSNMGRVRSYKNRYGAGRELLNTPTILKGRKDQAGYVQYCLYTDDYQKRKLNFRAHQLVAQTFIGYSSELNILHNDDKKDNNNLNNLRYGTQKENIKDRIKNRSTKNY